jgi:NhaP-type Na+/H+ or K+/H+ antiporter
MTSDQILAGAGLIAVLAVGSQLLAARLRLPAIILLLPVGFTAGALTDDVHPDKLLGPAFSPLVSLAVAVILYDAGLELDLRRLTGTARRTAARLIWIGTLVTWPVAALVAAPLLHISAKAAVMLGVILIVSGPTVVGPLLNFVRPGAGLRWCSRRWSPAAGWVRARPCCTSSPAPEPGSSAACSGRRCSGCCSAGSGSANCWAPPPSWP